MVAFSSNLKTVKAVAAAAVLLGGNVAAAPSISVLIPQMIFIEGLDAAGSMALQPGSGTMITADAGTTINEVKACFDSTTGPYIQYEDAFVCPGSESLTPIGATCAWEGSQFGGGCMTLTGAASAAAYSEVAWQIRYLNGAPFGGATVGDRTITLSVTDSGGATGITDFKLTVRHTDALEGQCPTMEGAQAVDVLPTQLQGGAGIRIAINTLLTSSNTTALVNAHVRITGGCVPTQDVLGVDYSVAPVSIGSAWYADTCDLTLFNVAGAAPAVWQAALRNVIYRNAASAGAVTLGTRTITMSVGQVTPVECRSNYVLASVNLVDSLPTPSSLPPSASATSLPSPSDSPTSILIAVQGTPTEEPTIDTSGASSTAMAVVTAALAALVAVLTL